MKTKISAFILFLLLNNIAFSQDASTPEGRAAIQKNTRHYPGTPITKFSDVVMKFKIKENEFSRTSPALYEGIPYLGTMKDAAVGVEGFNFKGAWGLDNYGSVDGSPAVTDKYVIVGYSNKKIVAFNRTEGTLAWEYATKAAVNTTPLISGKYVYACCADGAVYCLNLEDGSFKWKFFAVAAAATPSIYRDVLYVGNVKYQTTYALDIKNGNILWQYDGAGGTPVLSEDLIYVRQKNGSVVALDLTTGRKVWSMRSTFQEPSSAMVYTGNALIIGDVTRIVALNGRQSEGGLWEKTLPRPLAGSPIAVGNVLYVPCTDWKMYVLDIETGKDLVAENPDIGFAPEGSPAFANGKLFYPNKETLYTYEAEGAEPAAGTSDASADAEKATLLAAAEYGHLDVVKDFIEKKGESPIQRTTDGKTPLHLAAEYGHTAVVAYLIEKRANVSVKTNTGRTPLSLASEYGHEEASKELLAKGANADDADSLGRTPLMYAAWYNHPKVVRTLIAAGANVNKVDNKGMTALFHGGIEGASDACNELLLNGADVNIIDKLGQTALIHTAWEGKDDIVEKMIAKGAKLDVQDEDGYTALMKAAEYDHGSTCTLLVKKGANTKLKNKMGKTAYDIAKGLGKTSAATALKGK